MLKMHALILHFICIDSMGVTTIDASHSPMATDHVRGERVYSGWSHLEHAKGPTTPELTCPGVHHARDEHGMILSFRV